MGITRRLFALLLCLTLILCSLSSCDVIDRLQGGTKRDADKYEAEVRVVFATNDEKMSAAVNAMSSSATIKADGENMYVLTTAESGDTTLTETYTVLDGKLYHLLSVQSGAYYADKREKADFSDTDTYMLLSEIGTGADIDITDFETSRESEGADDKKTYTCSDITDQAIEGLHASLSDDFAPLGATVNIKDVTFILETEGDLEMKTTLSCDLEISMNGESYEITMRTYTTYDYDVNPEISAPSDADTYKEASYKDILG